MNPSGFAQAVVGALRRQPQFPAPPTGFKPSVGGSAVVRPVRSDRSDKDRAIALARQVIRQGDMMLTASEAALVSRELLLALRIRP